VDYSYKLNENHFEWDLNKEKLNIKKHGISFKEAATVFEDRNVVRFYDSENSVYEDRFLALGLNIPLKLLFVCYCMRNDGKVIRIISARKATKRETKFYYRRGVF